MTSPSTAYGKSPVRRQILLPTDDNVSWCASDYFNLTGKALVTGPPHSGNFGSDIKVTLGKKAPHLDSGEEISR